MRTTSLPCWCPRPGPTPAPAWPPTRTPSRAGEHGVDATRWGATRLDVEGIERADLVVTAAASQRREVVATVPEAAARTFTLLDLSAWLAAAPADPVTGSTDLLARAAAGRARLGERRERDLPDPMGRSLRHFRRCRRRVEAALVPFLD